ncbi:MAG: GNAT family N-acetyltransferase [Flavobacterium nitrogenifigens]|uniref:Ribosomal protein S18 acetylase RimI n=1 Tax=Flavobacterium nitrogenifigens TaxID=1617283 RepID=A0A521FFR8_9FLAO|nr:GNAT family N-acetyltransferase [Flavobacterium nitrogenifigens]KAF2339719.1 GNAT family N-acetyltransferase [Flavobacterium nitrogenifigens]MDQ8014736.1 GNAT family N-acetyltransferase [Flavobacterium nitrogenifigens]SMO94999.1 Ribosomal protein S18 acetylase RimI [Flavobacterium nitrogenifigens]
MNLEIKNISLRDIRESDKTLLREIYGSTRQEELDKGTNWNDEQKRLFIDQQFSVQHEYYQKNFLDAKFYIIENEKVPVGRLYIDFISENESVKVIDITILPEWRNKNIGSSILNEILKKAGSNNLKVSIHVEAFNPAMNLYKRLGFKKISETNGFYHLMEWNSNN